MNKVDIDLVYKTKQNKRNRDKRSQPRLRFVWKESTNTSLTGDTHMQTAFAFVLRLYTLSSYSPKRSIRYCYSLLPSVCRTTSSTRDIVSTVSLTSKYVRF